MASLRPVVKIEQTMKAADYLNIFVDKLYFYMESVFPIGNGVFQQGNTPCLKLFQEHKAEFHLMSWLLNSLDVNLIEHIWMSWTSSSELKKHHIRISWICMTAAQTSGTICLQPPTNDLWHSCQHMLQLFCIKVYQCVIKQVIMLALQFILVYMLIFSCAVYVIYIITCYLS